jgi:hypothetical protein
MPVTMPSAMPVISGLVTIELCLALTTSLVGLDLAQGWSLLMAERSSGEAITVALLNGAATARPMTMT